MANRYDELSDRARWFMENFDELAMAEICASGEQLQAAVDRVRAMAEAANTKPDAWAVHPAAVLAALDGKPQEEPGA